MTREAGRLAPGDEGAKLCRGLPPVVGRAPRVLILGSMPGAKSLQKRQYYANPQNQLWRILGELLGAFPELRYERRLARLRAARVALWDVALTCVRAGSADATIGEVVPNDFATLFRKAPTLQRVLCNGDKAFAMFTRRVVPQLAREGIDVLVLRLPSTSPAHASRDYATKLAAWRQALE